MVFSQYNSGEISNEMSYKDGLPCGPYKSYTIGGSIKVEGNYKIISNENCSLGCSVLSDIKSYHSNGRLKRKTDYRNGTAWEDRCYDENGDELKPCPKD